MEWDLTFYRQFQVESCDKIRVNAILQLGIKLKWVKDLINNHIDSKIDEFCTISYTAMKLLKLKTWNFSQLFLGQKWSNLKKNVNIFQKLPKWPWKYWTKFQQ